MMPRHSFLLLIVAIAIEKYKLMKTEYMHLDPAIRDWVLIPIMIVMLLVGILRHLATQWMHSNPKQTIAKIRERYP